MVRVITRRVSSDVILLLLILHYNGSLRQSLIYAAVYPFTYRTNRCERARSICAEINDPLDFCVPLP